MYFEDISFLHKQKIQIILKTFCETWQTNFKDPLSLEEKNCKLMYRKI